MSRTRRSYRSLMLAGASALTIGTLSATSFAYAQTAPAAADDDLQEIVVTGLRKSIQSSQAIKQNSEQMVDSITATDIGALPDRSVTEALQRISGITIQRTPDPRDADRISVEGDGVQVRGLSWVRGEFNGRDSFSAKSGRTLSFADIPAELMAGVDVYKNPSADLVEGGIGGTINLRTRLPFDSEERIIAYSADYSYGDLVGKGKPSGSALYSDRWNTGIGEVGVLIDVADGKFASRTDTVSVNPFQARTDLVPGQTVYVPTGLGYRSLEFTRERKGIVGALQWRPNSDLEFTAQYIRSEATEESLENAIGLDSGTGNGPAAGTSFKYDAQGNFISGTIADTVGGTTNNPDVIDSRYDIKESVTSDYSLHMKWTPTKNWNITGDVQYIDATSKQLDFTVFEALTSPLNAATLTLNGSGLPTISIPANTSFISNPANYYYNAAMDYHNNNEAHEWAERLDAEYSFDESDWLKSFRFGVRHTDRKSITRETNYNWGGVVQSWGANGIQTLNQTTPGASSASQWPLQNFYRGGISVPTQFIIPSASLSKGFYNGVAAQLKALSAADSYGNWIPFNGDYNAITGGGAGVNTQTEETTAGYALVRFEHDVPFFGGNKAFDGNVGFRIVNTDAKGVGAANFVTVTNINGAPSSDLAFANGARSVISGGRNYTDVLPSVNLRLKLQDNLQWRFAFAQSIVRPDFSQLQPSLNIGATAGLLDGNGVCQSLGSGATGNCIYQWTGYAGNPNLKPMRSNQFDTSIEWYFAPTGSITAGVFNKDVFDFITTSPQNVSFTNNGVTKNVLVVQPYNAGQGSVKGFEFGYTQFYDFLPGFLSGLGFQGNVTFVQSEGGRNAAANPYDATQVTNAAPTNTSLPLEGMSKWSYNLAGIYQKGPFEFRLAYNWRQRYLLTTSAANINIPAWSDDYGQLDASFFYTVNSYLKVGVEAANLTDAQTRILVGYPGHLTYHNWVDADRRYAFVIRGSL
ncbi:TonB-dependent receptor [Azospirillum sp. B4]|uniref:TonB-dependent receptor n=1 Tax=Azospirillum sp. B4 TaxID=95605 RepID=UPI0005C84249|nr:TonB-dependent receptor [Azospirillum sp. B4]